MGAAWRDSWLNGHRPAADDFLVAVDRTEKEQTMQGQILPDEQHQDSILTQIKEGMDVYSRDSEHIGEVERVFFGSVSEEESEKGVGAATADSPRMRERGWLDDLADVFRTDDIPQVLQNRYLREGFIRIDSAGLFAGDRYATPNQIASVSGDRVILKVNKNELFKD